MTRNPSGLVKTSVNLEKKRDRRRRKMSSYPYCHFSIDMLHLT